MWPAGLPCMGVWRVNDVALALGMLACHRALPMTLALLGPQEQLGTSLGSQVFPLKPVDCFDTQACLCPQPCSLCSQAPLCSPLDWTQPSRIVVSVGIHSPLLSLKRKIKTGLWRPRSGSSCLSTGQSQSLNEDKEGAYFG